MISTFSDIDSLQLFLFDRIQREGEVVTVRGKKTREITSVAVKLSNPRRRCTTLTHRNWSLNFAIGEFAWHMSMSQDLNSIAFYSKEWRNASEDGQFIYGSCYGYKIFAKDSSGDSQWSKLISLLTHDLFSRRAVLSLYDSSKDLDNLNSKDVPCTGTIQVLCRNGRVDMVVYMRSNDIVWGLPNDIFFFTMLQEILATELKMEVGTYTHMAGSVHLYERHFKLAEAILKNNGDVTSEKFEMPIMRDLIDLPAFLAAEGQIRTGVLRSTEKLAQMKISRYWKDLLTILLLKAHQNSTITHSDLYEYLRLKSAQN